MKITEIKNKELQKIKTKPIKERMDVFVPNIPQYLSSRNGMLLCFMWSRWVW